jgi:hypothetical protein
LIETPFPKRPIGLHKLPGVDEYVYIVNTMFMAYPASPSVELSFFGCIFHIIMPVPCHSVSQ